MAEWARLTPAERAPGATAVPGNAAAARRGEAGPLAGLPGPAGRRAPGAGAARPAARQASSGADGGSRASAATDYGTAKNNLVAPSPAPRGTIRWRRPWCRRGPGATTTTDHQAAPRRRRTTSRACPRSPPRRASSTSRRCCRKRGPQGAQRVRRRRCQRAHRRTDDRAGARQPLARWSRPGWRGAWPASSTKVCCCSASS